MVRIEDYTPIVGAGEVESIKEMAEHVRGAKVEHINATSFGGGVAEILNRLVPLARSVGIDAEWKTLSGDEDFFLTTKRIHNALQGDGTIEISEGMMRHYIDTNDLNASKLNDSSEVVVIHDPQPLPMIDHKTTGKWVWRCHIDTSSPNIKVWNLINGYVKKYDAAIFSLEKYVPEDLAQMRVLIDFPTIDPLSAKNASMSASEVLKILERYGIDPDRPIIGQVARFDPWKNPLGVIDTYRRVKEKIRNVQLIMIGSFANDDLEGTEWHNRTVRYAQGDKDIHILTNLEGVLDKEVNAFQRSFNVALQLSLREGFGLSVTEALWKGVPVVGTKAGGIPLQVIDGVTGYLVGSLEEAADATRQLIKRPWAARELGYAGMQLVRLNFLITKGLKSYLRMHIELVGK